MLVSDWLTMLAHAQCCCFWRLALSHAIFDLHDQSGNPTWKQPLSSKLSAWMNMTFVSGQLGIPSSSSGEENSKNDDVICAMLFGLLLNRILLTLPTSSKQFNIFASGSAMSTKIPPVEQKDKVLLEVLSNGKGSLDYAKNLVKFGSQLPDPPVTKPPWCTCRICQPMPTEEENKCCKKIQCVTSFVTFVTLLWTRWFHGHTSCKSQN